MTDQRPNTRTLPPEWEGARKDAYLRGERHFLSERPCSNNPNHRARYVKGPDGMPPCFECQLLRNPSAQRQPSTLKALERLGIVLENGGSAPAAEASKGDFEVRDQKQHLRVEAPTGPLSGLDARMTYNGYVSLNPRGQLVFNVLRNPRTAVYAFVVDGAVQYLGQTSKYLVRVATCEIEGKLKTGRFGNYTSSPETNNPLIRSAIANAIRAKKVVYVYTLDCDDPLDVEKSMHKSHKGGWHKLKFTGEDAEAWPLQSARDVMYLLRAMSSTYGSDAARRVAVERAGNFYAAHTGAQE